MSQPVSCESSCEIQDESSSVKAAEMSSGTTRFDQSDLQFPGSGGNFETGALPDLVSGAVDQAARWLLQRQHPEGYWCGELEGDTILESEYLLLLAWMGRLDNPVVAQCAETIRRQQLPGGGWAMYPGGPLEVSGSVKAYWVLKLAGDSPDLPHMKLAREAILAAGGAERVNSFTRYYMALLGIISYRQVPAVPPEIMLLPRWCPFNIYEMSAWSRTILVPLSLLWAFQPKTKLPAEHRIDELFLDSPSRLPITMPKSDQVDDLKARTLVPWHAVFQWIDRIWKGIEAVGIKPLRARAVRLAADWMIRRFENSDGLGAIFPPIIWSVIALRCLGEDEDSPTVVAALNELEKLTIREGATARLEPCRSPVWDTAISVNALREAGVPAAHAAVERAVDWLLAKEVRSRGDWAVNHPGIEPGGWYFEFHNEFYPDVDDTIMVTMALSRCLGPDRADNSDSRQLVAELLDKEGDLRVILAGQTEDPLRVVSLADRAQRILAAIRRGVRWTCGMQCRDGGWAAFDSDNDREVLTRVPFADHNAMIDPPTADITARVLEMFGRLGHDRRDPGLEKAIQFVWQGQEPDGSWYGRWGVNYIYGTWQVLVGLREIGIPATDPRLQAGARWLIEKQQANGGWGETPRSYDEPQLRGTGPVTASQTAWAVMGLIAAGLAESEAVRRGIEFLCRSQTEEGTWNEPWFTGTGFPRVFYLRYHLYRHYFPLMALGRYLRQTRQQTGRS